MVDKDSKTYVSKSDFDQEIGALHKKIDGVERTTERSIFEMKGLLGVVQNSFDMFNSNVEEMVKNQKETNEELKEITSQNVEYGIRITRTEQRQDSYESSKAEYRKDVMKIILTIVASLATLAGSVLLASLGLK